MKNMNDVFKVLRKMKTVNQESGIQKTVNQESGILSKLKVKGTHHQKNKNWKNLLLADQLYRKY